MNSNIKVIFFKAVELIEAKNYRKADKMLGEIIEECPKFKRAVVARRQMRATLKAKKQKQEIKM